MEWERANLVFSVLAPFDALQLLGCEGLRSEATTDTQEYIRTYVQSIE